ncbi:TPA: hypothetical protein H2A59_004977 [Salmonella enterica]|nr:hypothetical protein [Salmonella enterica]
MSLSFAQPAPKKEEQSDIIIHSRKRLEGRALKGECRAHNSNSAWQEQKNRPSRARPDAGY